MAQSQARGGRGRRCRASLPRLARRVKLGQEAEEEAGERERAAWRDGTGGRDWAALPPPAPGLTGASESVGAAAAGGQRATNQPTMPPPGRRSANVLLSSSSSERSPLLTYRLCSSVSVEGEPPRPAPGAARGKLSTFLGVVVPTLLSMFSVVLFLRLGECATPAAAHQPAPASA